MWSFSGEHGRWERILESRGWWWSNLHYRNTHWNLLEHPEGDGDVEVAACGTVGLKVGGCGSVVEPASCFCEVAGLIPLFCMWKCPWARYWTLNCSWYAGWHLAWQLSPFSKIKKKQKNKTKQPSKLISKSSAILPQLKSFLFFFFFQDRNTSFHIVWVGIDFLPSVQKVLLGGKAQESERT